MAKMNFTPTQQAAIDLPHGNILVSAAAGSGKTAVLTERVLRLLTGENPIPADSLVIVTFTVAASIEMRQRIEQKLADRLEEDPQNEQLKSQQLLLARAKISTIHSLCSSLIKENFQALSLSPKFRLAEDNEIKNLEAEELEALLEAQYQEKSPAFMALARYFTDRDDRVLAELIAHIYHFIRQYPFSLTLLPDYLSFYDTDRFLDSWWGQEVVDRHLLPQLGRMQQSMEYALSMMEGDDTLRKAYYPIFDDEREVLTLLMRALSQKDWDKACEIAMKTEKKRLTAVRKYPNPALLETLKTIRGNMHDQLEKLTERFFAVNNQAFAEDQQILRDVLKTLFVLVEQYANRIGDKKKSANLLDYSDLEHFALSLLVEKTDAGYRKTPLAVELSAQYAEVMVDECQDINRLQNLIFWALSKGDSFLSKEETVPQAENLFMVGDVKQSIYRFRNAVPALFVQKRKRFPLYQAHEENKACTVLLGHNFRSREQVTKPINFLFQNLMSEWFGGIDYTEEEALVSAASFLPYEQANTELHLLQTTKQEDGTTANDLEADYIADLIEQMVQTGYQVQDKGTLRDCTYRDFCVLLRTKKGKVDRYLNRMREKGLPCFSEASTGYFSAPEIATMLHLLRVIDNPLQDISLFTILTSPIFCFTPDEIMAMRLEKRKGALYFGVTALAEKGDFKAKQFLGVLATLREQSAVLSIEQLIQLIYDHTGFLSLVEMQESGEQKRANLSLLLHYAAHYQSLGGQGVDGFLRYLDRAIARGEDFSSANVASERANVVRIMSIHGSKGLEFPICIVADTAKPFNMQDVNAEYLTHPDFGVAFKTRKPETMQRYSNLALESMRLRELQDAKSEELRVLYVAATRAKEKLIFVGTAQNAESRVLRVAEEAISSKDTGVYALAQNNVLNWLLATYAKVSGFAQCYQTPMPKHPQTLPMTFYFKDLEQAQEVQEKQHVFTKTADQSLLAQLTNRLAFCYQNLPLTKLATKVTATQLAKEKQGEDLQPLPKRNLVGEGVLDGAAHGTILHTFMQFADFDKASENLEEEIARLVSAQFLTKREADALNQTAIKTFLSSALYQRIKTAVAVHREYAFLYAVSALEIDPQLPIDFANETVLMQGIADLVLEEQDGVIIVDYKTDRLNREEEFITRYQRQLVLYRAALTDYFEKPIKACYLYSLHLGKSIAVEIEK